MSIYYIYRVTNTITNQFYIGSRTSNVMAKRKPEEDLWVHYFTSSKVIKSQIQQYGKDAFVAEIRFLSDDITKVYNYEQIAIFYSISNPKCLNQSFCNLEGKNIFSTAGRKHTNSVETRAKMSAAKTGVKKSVITRAKMSAAKKGLKKSAEHQAKINAALTGIKKTDEQKARMSADRKGRGKGKTRSEEAKNKTSAALKGRTLSEEHKANLCKAWEKRRLS